MSEATVTRATTPVTELLFLHAQTSLHPGSGTALGVVDLPIQRERHTQWPVVPGTSLKGILRDACRRGTGNKDDLNLIAAFGPETDNADKHAGALSLTDARILAFPVRSLRGVFAWVTCKAVLDRLNRDLSLAKRPAINTDFKLEPEQAVCAEKSPLLVDGDKFVLEEFEFRQAVKKNPPADWIAENAVADNSTRERIRSCLVVLHDDDFTHFVRHATEVVARVGLDYEKKTVRTGALFYQECLPPETLFYSLVFANRSRHQGHRKEANEIMAYLRSNLPPQTVLQIGGDETTGKGLCAVRLSNQNGGVQ